MEQNAQPEIKAHLMQTNEQFRELVNRHHEYDVKVGALEAKQALTPEEELEEHRLKKLKLHLKDEIQQFLHDHTLQHAG
jgi:uncharacterized protein YdcH (DUF465 family)